MWGSGMMCHVYEASNRILARGIWVSAPPGRRTCGHPVRLQWMQSDGQKATWTTREKICELWDSDITFLSCAILCSASVTEPAHPPTSPPTKRRRREAMTASKRHLAPQTKPNKPQRKHYSYIANNTLLFAQQHFDKKFLLGSSDLITEALWTFIAHVIWATSWGATMNYPSFFSHAGLCLDREDLSQGHTTPLHFVWRLVKRKTSTKELSVCVCACDRLQILRWQFLILQIFCWDHDFHLMSRIAALSLEWCSVNIVSLIRHCSGDALPSMFQVCVSSDTPLNDQPVSRHHNETFITIREGRLQDKISKESFLHGDISQAIITTRIW